MSDGLEKQVEETSPVPQQQTNAVRNNGNAQNTSSVHVGSAFLDIQLIAIGQGGASIATKIKETLGIKESIIAIDTSSQYLDILDIPSNFKMKIGGPKANGAGKDRSISKAYFKEFKAKLEGTEHNLDFITTFTALYEEILFGLNQKLIFVCFSSAGGTGSGIGPMFTTMLTSFINNKKDFNNGDDTYVIDDRLNSIPRPIVIGLTVLPDKNEELIESLQNGIQCSLEMQNTVDKRLATYLVASNAIEDGVKWNTIQEKYEIINSRLASALLKFLTLELNSDLKCVDLQDKINSLRITGFHTFLAVDSSLRANMFQFITPKLQPVIRLVSLLNIDSPEIENDLEKLLRDNEIACDDKISGFFDPKLITLDNYDKVAKSLVDISIVGLFGYKNLSTVVEQLRNKLHSIEIANAEKEATVATSGTGFDTVARDNDMISKKRGSATIDTAEILDMF